MPDPLARSTSPEAPLFQRSTSRTAGAVAATKVGSWRQKILDRLRVHPSCIFEIAEFYHVPKHTISGRFSEMESDLLIRKTGERRRNPGGNEEEVYDLYGKAKADDPDAGELLGYPLTLNVNAELYDRQQLLPSETYPGIPYSRRADTGGVRQVVRVAIVECPGCGNQLLMQEKDGIKSFQCVRQSCGRTWQVKAVNEPGRGQILALVMFTM